MKFTTHIIRKKLQAGFTLIELMVSIGIMILIISVILVNYGKFDTGIILTNLAYDVGLSVRKAQTYGISVKGVATTSTQYFQSSYGIHFDSAYPKNYLIFADYNNDGKYTCPNPNDVATCEKVEGFTLGASYKLGKLYTHPNSGVQTEVKVVDITFKRPNPDATINVVDLNNSYRSPAPTDPVEITLTSTQDLSSIKTVIVRTTGQISIQ